MCDRTALILLLMWLGADRKARAVGMVRQKQQQSLPHRLREAQRKPHLPHHLHPRRHTLGVDSRGRFCALSQMLFPYSRSSEVQAKNSTTKLGEHLWAPPVAKASTRASTKRSPVPLGTEAARPCRVLAGSGAPGKGQLCFPGTDNSLSPGVPPSHQ